MALVCIVVTINEAQRKELDPTHLTFGERGGVLLQDIQAILPVL